jgi:Mycoplasma protein of unknown function, DUF285
MFGKAISFHDDGLQRWNTSRFQNMAGMVVDAEAFNRDISKGDVSSVITMSQLVQGAMRFDSEINSWDVSRTTDMSFIYVFGTNCNSPLSSCDLEDATSFNQLLDTWNVSAVHLANRRHVSHCQEF